MKYTMDVKPDLGSQNFLRSYVMEEGVARTIRLRGTQMNWTTGEIIEVQADTAITIKPMPGELEPGGRLLRNDASALTGIKVTDWPTSERMYIPSDRTLAEILLDVVQHAEENPTHGPGCACIDEYSYELKRHIWRALPERTADAYQNAEQWAAVMRPSHFVRALLNQVIRGTL